MWSAVLFVTVSDLWGSPLVLAGRGSVVQYI